MSGSGDYISREAVKQIIAAQCGECADACLEFDGIQPDCNQCSLHGAAKAINGITAADVRPVVTCGECIHGQGEKMDFWNEYKGIECIGGVVHRKDWFCADGERMDVE